MSSGICSLMESKAFIMTEIYKFVICSYVFFLRFFIVIYTIFIYLAVFMYFMFYS